MLGPIGARVGTTRVAIGGPRQQVLLALLSLHAGRVVSTDALVDAVWDGAPPDAAERTFRTYVARLRKALTSSGVRVDGTELVAIEQGGYRLDDQWADADADRFEALVADARERLTAGEATTAKQLLDDALGLWRGPAYGPFADRPWARSEALRLEELRVVARELRLRAMLDAGHLEEASAEAAALGAEHPHREAVARLRVLARYRSGRHAAAIDVIREFRARLVEDTGLDPSARFEELERMVLAQDPRLDRPVGGNRLRGYVLHEVIAETALGLVHRAEQPSIGRQVAITVVPASLADDPEVVRTFEARAQQWAAVEHPHVVPLYDYWREPGGAYLVTRFVHGGTLAQRIARGPLDEHAARAIVAQVGAAVVAAHERGVGHGAITPAAVVLDEEGAAYLAGFPLVEPEDARRRDLTGLAALVLEVLRASVPAGTEARHPDTREPTVDPEVVALAEAARDDADDRVTTTAGLLEQLAPVLRAGAGGAAPGPARPTSPGPNPYRGLAAFRETDAAVFFGRDDLVDEIVGRLARQPFVAVTGPSGSGKSSVVRAGVLPRLRATGAYVTTMHPGTAPLDELAVALARIAATDLGDVADRLASGPDQLTGLLHDALPTATGDAVLVVDQFEELWTLTPRDERRAFLEVLVRALDHPQRRLQVVATVRADFLDRVLEDETAGPLVQRRTVLTRSLSAEELYEAIVGPAEVAGVAVEPEFATAVTAEGVRSTGSLPMVQFALTEVFEAAEDGTMTLAAYRRLGGIEGVLAQRAEEVHAALDADGRLAARALFRRLVVPHDDGPPTRRRATRSELTAVDETVIAAFGAARLLRFDHDEASREPTVEVSHEALFRAWPRLVAWIEEEVDDVRLLGHLTVAASDWVERGRDEGDLYRGARLDVALEFAARHRDELSATEQAFVDASRRRRARDEERNRRTVRRLRVLTGGLAIGLVGALVASGLAVTAQRNERDARRAEERIAAQAQEAATVAQADALAAAARLAAGDDLELAVLYALEAYAVDPDPDSTAALGTVLATDPRVTRIISDAVEGQGCRSAPPIGEVTITSVPAQDGPGVALVRDAALNEIATVPLTGFWACPTVDPQGRWVIAGDMETAVVRTLDVATGDVLAERDGWGPTFRQWANAAMSPTGDEALLMTSEGGLERVTLPDLELLEALDVQGVTAAAYDERGTTFAAVTTDDVVVVTQPDGTLATSGAAPDELWWVVAAGAAGVVLAASELDLYATDLVDPGPLRTVDLEGVPVAPPAVAPDGGVVAIPTSAGVEVLALPELTNLGPPVVLDTGVGRPAWGADGTLRWLGRDAAHLVDLGRLTTGERISDATPVGEGLHLAHDGSGALNYFTDRLVWVDLETGEERVLFELPEEGIEASGLADEGYYFHTATPVDGGRWLHIDLVQRVVELGHRTEVTDRVPLPDVVPTFPPTTFSAPRLDAGYAAMVTSSSAYLGTVERAWVLVFDATTGALVLAHEHDGDPPTEPVMARVLDDDHVVVTHRDGQIGLLSMDGEQIGPRRPLAERAGWSRFAISPDRSLVAVADATSPVIELLDRDLERVGLLADATSPPGHIEFTTEGTLVTRHYDGQTLVWDTETQTLVGPVVVTAGFGGNLFAAADEGDAILHTMPTGVFRVPVTAEAWVAEACAIVSRPLSQAELDRVTEDREPLDPCGHGGPTA